MKGKIIAFSGKGGSGKTTVTALVLRHLIRTGRTPILAVDADPNSTLAMALGIEQGETIADLRDKMGAAAEKVNEIPKERIMDLYLSELLNEQTGFDLLAMGRPEGPKCYCYVNALLRRYLSLLRKNYAYVLVDCEAGMEYLSRLVVDEIETIVLVAEATAVGLVSVKRITQLADSLPINVRRRVLALNKVAGRPMVSTEKIPEVDSVVELPFDNDIMERCVVGRGIDDSAGPSVRDAVEALTNRCLGLGTKEKPARMQKESTG